MVMKCCHRSNSVDENMVPLKEYRKRMNRERLKQEPFGDITEQRVCDQARTIQKPIDEEERINTTGTQKTSQEGNQNVKDSFSDPEELFARAELSISINEV